MSELNHRQCNIQSPKQRLPLQTPSIPCCFGVRQNWSHDVTPHRPEDSIDNISNQTCEAAQALYSMQCIIFILYKGPAAIILNALRAAHEQIGASSGGSACFATRCLR